MTMTDGQFLADELRSIFDEHSAHGAPVVDRRAGVDRRIVRHKRVRTLTALAAVVFLAGGTSGALTWQRHHGTPVQPAVTPSPTMTPGRLPEYWNGGHRDASATIDAARQTAGTFTFTPTTWDMEVTESCAATGTDTWLTVSLNGHNLGGMSCSPGGGNLGSNRGTFGQHEKFWRELGVQMGVPSTVTFEVGKPKKAHTTHMGVTPTLSSGLASVGVYNPVPYDEYPLPPKPTDWNATASVGMGTEAGMRQLGQIGQFGKSDTSHPLTVTLPSRLEIIMKANAPGTVRVYFNGVEVAEFGSYDWGGIYDSGAAAVGAEQFAGFVKGQPVVVTVQTDHFTVANAAEVLIYGK